MATIKLLPNVYNDVTTLASLTDSDPVNIEYAAASTPSQLVFLALLSAAPNSDADGQAFLVCDHKSDKSVRTVQGVSGSKIYAWFPGKDGDYVNIMVG